MSSNWDSRHSTDFRLFWLIINIQYDSACEKLKKVLAPKTEKIAQRMPHDALGAWSTLETKSENISASALIVSIVYSS